METGAVGPFRADVSERRVRRGVDYPAGTCAVDDVNIIPDRVCGACYVDAAVTAEAGSRDVDALDPPHTARQSVDAEPGEVLDADVLDRDITGAAAVDAVELRVTASR